MFVFLKSQKWGNRAGGSKREEINSDVVLEIYNKRSTTNLHHYIGHSKKKPQKDKNPKAKNYRHNLEKKKKTPIKFEK